MAAISFSKGTSGPGTELDVPVLAGRFFTAEPSGKPHECTCIYADLSLSETFAVHHCQSTTCR